MKELIVITGSSGRVGSRLIAKLQENYRIVGLDSKAPEDAPSALSFIETDLTSEESVARAFRDIKRHHGQEIGSFIHLAAYYSFTDENWDKYEKITIKGTERILHHLQEFDAKQFIFSSTMLVHAPSKKRLHEDSPLGPKWAYPRSKMLTEKLILEKRGIVPAVILRIAGCYDDECHSIPIANMIQRIYEMQLTARLFPGNLRHGAAYLHFDDLIHAIKLAIEKRPSLNEEVVLLIGEHTTYSYDDMQRKLWKHLHDKERSTFRIPKWFAKFGAFLQNHMPFMPKPFIQPWMIDLADDNYALDTTLAKHLLGWEPDHSVYESLSYMAANLEKGPYHWYLENGLRPPAWLQKKKLH